jgi:hypothetical protein
MIDPAHEPSRFESVVTLVGSLAWPIVSSTVLIVYRGELRELLKIFIQRFRSDDTVKVGGVEFGKKIIANAISNVPVASAESSVPQSQVEGARKLEANLESAGIAPSESLGIVRGRLEGLATLYETTRESMERGSARTERLDRIVAQMRTLALLAVPLLPEFVISASPGERLAAIATLQVHPDSSYTTWLSERMSVEVPFIFFHAALALRQIAVTGNFPIAELRSRVEHALEVILQFRDGVPDRNTVRVLEDTLEILSHI